MEARKAPIVKVQTADFDLAAETKTITANDYSIGAVVSFTGLCRDEGGVLAALELEHYPGMAEAKLQQIAEEAHQHFELNAISIIHRYGKIAVGEQIVLVIAASSHRQAAFDGANFVMDYLKTEAPFWKKEHALDGSGRQWVSAKDGDDSALAKWNTPTPL
jgi:molybdopterin synthase catalytic subunit